VIGRELSKKYRFEEGSGYQRSSLGMSPDYLPSKMQLAHDLLRLGQELEGWKLAEEVFDADQYNVVANNLVALRDNLSEFATLEKDGFVVRMERGEADCYGHMVFELLEDASQQLTKKYEVELQKPIFIEIFPRQQDFAIRTFGLPGGAGFLGVCFGRVVTMNSPVAQGASQTNWRSVLWHEFCHVVTLQKTKNKMPRWLSEGISVYEERLANSAWGDSIDPGHRMMIIGGELTPVSQLSNAFLSPKSAQHLQFAYFESSLVVEYLIGKFGEHAMVAMLDDLGTGMPINDALQRHMASTAYLDKEFAKYARKIASGLAPDADWTPPKEPIADVAGWEKWLGQHPKNYYGLLGSATVLVKSKKFERALERLDELDAIYGNANGAERAYRLRATANRGLQRESAERDALEKAIGRDASDLASCSRLLDIYSANGKWEELKKWQDELKGGQLRQGDRDSARRNALLALEAAPRYRDAHKLLLKSLPAEYDESTDQPQGTDDE
jgi:hypothetical protein